VHVDLPGPDEIERLLAHRGPACVSIYLPTRPDTPDGEQERIGWKNLAADALRLLRSRGVDDREAPRWRALLDAVDSDARFWRYQARTLAAFTDGDAIRTFQLPNRLPELVTVTNRFHVKPLLRSVTFPQACFVLALTQGSVRLWEIGADFGPFEVPVSDLPADADGFLRSAPGGERSPMQRITGDEGQKVRLAQFARAVDRSVREALRGVELPVVLAATEPVAGIYREISGLPHLADEDIAGSPERMTGPELAQAARAVLDRMYAAQLQELRARFDDEAGRHRTATDLADLARAATHGAVDVLLVDVDDVVTGTIDGRGGLHPGTGPETYDVIDEIARRVLQTRGRVLAVRADDVPGGGSAAAILRWA